MMRFSFTLQQAKALLIAIIMVGAFFSNVQAQSFSSNPCVELTGKWDGKMRLHHRDWSTTATGAINPDNINLNIFAILLPQENPPIATGFDLYGWCDNGKLYFQDKHDVFVGTVGGGIIELKSSIATIKLNKVAA